MSVYVYKLSSLYMCINYGTLYRDFHDKVHNEIYICEHVYTFHWLLSY